MFCIDFPVLSSYAYNSFLFLAKSGILKKDFTQKRGMPL